MPRYGHYGVAQPNLTTQSVGSGKSYFGVRGGAGKPGYPVPDRLRFKDRDPDLEDDNDERTPLAPLSKVTTQTVESLVHEMLNEYLFGGGNFGGGLGDNGGMRPGSSSWSSPWDQMTDEDEEGQGLWQTNLKMLAIR